MPVIEYLLGGSPTAGSGDVEFVGGPRAGERDRLDEPVGTIPMEGGFYRRSVSCADDGATRYLWQPDEEP